MIYQSVSLWNPIRNHFLYQHELIWIGLYQMVSKITKHRICSYLQLQVGIFIIVFCFLFVRTKTMCIDMKRESVELSICELRHGTIRAFGNHDTKTTPA